MEMSMHLLQEVIAILHVAIIKLHPTKKFSAKISTYKIYFGETMDMK